MSVLAIERDGGVLTLRLNRPAVMNAINRELGEQLLKSLAEAGRDPAVRAVVITGAGAAFCSGDDIEGLGAWLEGDFDHPAAGLNPIDGSSVYLGIMATIAQLPKPVLAGVNGVAAGAGAEICSVCDLRYGAASARIGSGLIKVGQVGAMAGFGNLIGYSKAMEILLSGRLVTAEEGLRLGVFHEVLPDDDFEGKLQERAQRAAAMPTRVVALYKEAREAMTGRPIGERLRIQEQFHQVRTRPIRDAAEGARAFIEKRRPQFTGE